MAGDSSGARESMTPRDPQSSPGEVWKGILLAIVEGFALLVVFLLLFAYVL